MKKLFALLLTLFTAASASAQITIPNTFSPNTVAQSALVNANFSQVGSLALNRAGGNLTGNVTADGGVTIDGVDIGATICTTCDPTFDDLTLDTLTAVSATLSGALNAGSIDVTGGIQAGSGNVDIIDSSGRIPTISSTYFASLSGANLTGITEASITDSTILARVASNETISGLWAFTNTSPTLFSGSVTLANTRGFYIDNTAGSDIPIGEITGSNQLNIGSDNSAGMGDTVLSAGSALRFRTSSSERTSISGTGVLAHGYALRWTNVLAPAALASGGNNDYAPTGIGDAVVLVVTGHASNSTLTGISGGATGRVLYVCDSDSGGTVTIAHESSGSAAGNRFDLGVTVGADPRLRTTSTAADYPGPCMHFVYFNSRWTLMGSPAIGG